MSRLYRRSKLKNNNIKGEAATASPFVLLDIFKSLILNSV